MPTAWLGLPQPDSGTSTYECLHLQTFQVTNGSVYKMLFRLVNGALTYEPEKPFLLFFNLSSFYVKKNKKFLPLVVEYGLTDFALVPMGTNALTYELCLDIRTKTAGTD